MIVKTQSLEKYFLLCKLEKQLFGLLANNCNNVLRVFIGFNMTIVNIHDKLPDR